MDFSTSETIRNQWGTHPCKPKIQTLSLAVVALFLGACASNGNNYYSETNKVDFAGPYQIIDRDSFEEIDLIRILDPNGKAQKDTAWTTMTPGQKIDKSIDQFYQNIEEDNKSSPTKQAARNRVQDRILAASTQRCGAFKSNLQRAFSRTNFGLGVATTLAGIGGAITSGVYTSKYLSGLSGLFGGTRAEFNQDYYANLTVNVIVDGIEIRQQEVFRQISSGQDMPIERYSVESAIKDAIFYHNQCSLVSGLQAASEAIKFSADPGLDGATRIMLKAHNLKKIVEGSAPDASLTSSIERLAVSGRLYAGSLLRARGDASAALGAVIEATERANKLSAEFKVRVDNQKGGFEESDAAKNISDAAKDTHTRIVANIGICEKPAKELMADLAKKQALLPFAANESASGSLQAEIQTLNVKAGFVTAAAQRHLEELSSALRSSSDKLGKPDQKTSKPNSQDIVAKLKNLSSAQSLCNGI